MAQPAFAYPQQQNRGTLPPGQTISVNKYTVQVERYLSQGGFAHVYVVRTATPINGTTQHVLKRIAVSDEAMLNEVKKEVDIMRILRGHPNIVNLIDASWHALPNGMYEVFILMELCSGGGIIDMMNRRLRERLTEAEILQVFVDVCEAVAAMHNLKPPLLHRDLKVENILQSSLTRYKLCDFGSSTPVAPRPPSSTQEIRALEADLNRHTTLQYRAPEMVDVYLRRPVDEKSDVWALGVLLYKLCYYTTPFEEHGPLAILNVQYRIPPYPVYSSQMNSLIGSMLRELGTQRPSVFEILNHVHRMRGTKSPYRYNIPTQQPLRPPPQESSQSGLDNLVSFRTSPTPSANANAAAQARQTVLDAIAPMRRGRPVVPASSSSPSVPQQTQEPDVRKFEEQWNAVKGARVNDHVDDPWAVGAGKAKDNGKAGFGGGFDGFGDSFVEPSFGKTTPTLATSPSPATSKPVSNASLDVKKDAFDGLGGISRSREPSPTLAEATGNTKLAANGSARPPPRLSGISRTPVPTTSSTLLSPRIPASRTGLATYHSSASLTAEERFPSLDDLDKDWRSSPPSQILPAHAPSQPELGSKPASSSQFARPSQHNALPPSNGTGELRPSESKITSAPLRGESRSQQVTGTAMRGGRAEMAQPMKAPSPAERPPSALDSADKRQMPIGSSPTKYRPSRPALARKHRSSMSIKYTEPRSPPLDWLTGDDPAPVASPVERQPSPVKRLTASTIISTPAPRPATSDAPGGLGNLFQNAGTRYQQETKPPREDVHSSTDPAPRNDGASRIRPPMQTRRSENNAPHRRDSSSDDADGPEDVNDRVVDTDIRKRRAKGRQSSVHDLVDLYGGAARAPVDRERTGPPSPVFERKGRRTSGVLVDLSMPLPSAPSPVTLLSPATIVPESRAELASRRTGSSSHGERISPPASLADSRDQNSRPSSRASPSSSTTDRSDRPRPQSMFVFPATKPLDSTSNAVGAGGARQRPSPRRGSISDMVDLYENLGGGSRLKDPPAIASKPAGLKMNQTPSPITSRFPAISPTGASFPISQVTGLLADLPKLKPRPRRSPTTGSFSDTSSLGPPAPLKTTKDNDDFISRVPRRQSVSPAKPAPVQAPVKPTPVPAASPSKPAKPPSISIPMTTNNTTFTGSAQRTPVTESQAPISSPSPERPYQGVGKLIDQWQKKTEEADASRRPGPTPRAPGLGRPAGPRAALGRRETGQVGRGI